MEPGSNLDVQSGDFSYSHSFDQERPDMGDSQLEERGLTDHFTAWKAVNVGALDSHREGTGSNKSQLEPQSPGFSEPFGRPAEQEHAESQAAEDSEREIANMYPGWKAERENFLFDTRKRAESDGEEPMRNPASNIFDHPGEGCVQTEGQSGSLENPPSETEQNTGAVTEPIIKQERQSDESLDEQFGTSQAEERVMDSETQQSTAASTQRSHTDAQQATWTNAQHTHSDSVSKPVDMAESHVHKPADSDTASARSKESGRNTMKETELSSSLRQLAETGACQFSIASLDVFNKWWSIGSARGLSTDTEIASFLIALYENAESVVQAAARCVHCHNPLTLVCTKCEYGRKRAHVDSKQVDSKTNLSSMEENGETGDVMSNIPEVDDSKEFATCSVQASDTWDSLLSATFSKAAKRKAKTSVVKSTVVKSTPGRPGLRIRFTQKAEETKKPQGEEDSDTDDYLGEENSEDNEEAELENDDSETEVEGDDVNMKDLENAVKTAMKSVDAKREDEAKGPSSASKSTHVKTETKQDKKYPCVTCGKMFKRSTHLKRHERIHSGERPYVCPECGHSFTRSTHLKRHELIHKRPPREPKNPLEPRPKKPKQKPVGKSFVCEECGSAFSSSTDLKIHFRIHTGEKPYLCKSCGAAFITSGNMRRHERTHSGDRPFLCNECCASFTRCGDLRRHMKCHAGEKSYFCKECGAGFATFSFLRMHKRTHLEDMPYVCGICSAAFCTAGSLKRHTQTHYNDMPVPQLSLGHMGPMV